MNKEKIEEMFDEVFAKICDDVDKRSGERLWYLRVDESEKMLKKVIFNKIIPEVLNEIISLMKYHDNAIVMNYDDYIKVDAIKQKAKELYGVDL